MPPRDQAAFSSSRISKSGAGAPLSPQGGGGGPAAGPMCVTPRKSVMRCPPTPQRTPTCDCFEDSLLLEGGGSGGRGVGVGGGGGGVGDGDSSSGGSLGNSIRRSLRSHSKSRAGGSGGGAVGGVVGGDSVRGEGSTTNVGDDSMVIDAGLANSSGFSSLLAEAAGGKSAGAVGKGKGPATRAGRGSGGGDSGPREAPSTVSRSSVGKTGAVGRSGARGRGGKRRIVGGGVGNAGGGSGNAGGGGRGGGASSSSSSGGLGVRKAGAGGGARGEDTLGFKHDFVQMGPIGEGGFSVVWKVRAKGTGRLYAIKRSKREFRGRRDRDRCLLEAQALHRLGEHPGVLRFERAWQEEGHFCLQTELCELGTLKDFLERVSDCLFVEE